MITDDSFKETHTPTTPYPSKGDWKTKSLFILSIIEKGTAADVAGKLMDYEQTDNVAALEEHIEETLSVLVDEGHLKGELDGQVMIYGPINAAMQDDRQPVPCGTPKT
jgi:hypothetical protein